MKTKTESGNFLCIRVFFSYINCHVHRFGIWSKRKTEKEKVGGKPAKLNEKNGDRDLEWEIKNKWDIFLLEEQHDSFVAAVTKWEMQAATNAK